MTLSARAGDGQELVLALLSCPEEKQAEAVLRQLDRSFTNLDGDPVPVGPALQGPGRRLCPATSSDPDGRPADPEMARVFYRKSLDRYDQGYRIRSGHYPGINRRRCCSSWARSNSRPPRPVEGDRGVRGTRGVLLPTARAGRRASRRTRPSGIRRPPAKPTCFVACGTPPPSNMATPSKTGTSTLTPTWPCTSRWNASACASRSSGRDSPAARRPEDLSRWDWRRSKGRARARRATEYSDWATGRESLRLFRTPAQLKDVSPHPHGKAANMAPRTLHIVHLLVRHNRPDGSTGFLVYPHEHWKAPAASPISRCLQKKP